MGELSDIKMFVADFDGTLAGNAGVVSTENINALNRLGNTKVCRVIATGRSLFSLYQVIDDSFPVDYVVFSSGVGVINWKTKHVFHNRSLDADAINRVSLWLMQNEYDFMVHKPVPDNHIFYAHYSKQNHDDFMRRLSHYGKLNVEFLKTIPQDASQFVVICNNGESHYEIIKNAFNDLKVVQTTSPFDGTSLWVEIFPSGVSKAAGIEYLCKQLSVGKNSVVVAGNDYNDLDMLQWSIHSYVVENSPEDLKSVYAVIPSNLNNGVLELINRILKQT